MELVKKHLLVLFLGAILIGCGASDPVRPAAPSSPSGLTATAGDGQVTLTWTAVSGALSYNIYYGPAGGVTTANTKINTSASSYTVTGLTNKTIYYFAVAAVNEGGESSLSSEISVAPHLAGASRPITGAATNIANSSATVSGSFTNPAGTTAETRFEIGTSATYGTNSASQSYADPGNITSSTTFTFLAANTTYHYRFGIKAADGTWWYGSDQTFTTITLVAKTTIATGLIYPQQFAVDANNVYWTEAVDATGAANTGTVKKAAIAGGAATTLATGLSNPFGIAVNATNVYWSELNSIGSGLGYVKTVPIGGSCAGAACTKVTNTQFNNPQYIALDATNIYVTELGTFDTATGMRKSDGKVNKISLVTGAVTALATGLSGPQTIAIDATNVYWTEIANSVAGAGYIKQTPIIPGTTQTLLSGVSSSQNIAIDSSSVYFWSAYGALSKVAINGGNAAEVTSGMNGTLPLAVNASSIYWTENANGGAVKKLDKATGNVSIIAGLNCGWCAAMGIALDATNVYWMEGDVFDGTKWTGVGTIKTVTK